MVYKLTDDNLIFDTFKDDSAWLVRRTVVNKLKDPQLIKYFETDENKYVRNAVKLK